MPNPDFCGENVARESHRSLPSWLPYMALVSGDLCQGIHNDEEEYHHHRAIISYGIVCKQYDMINEWVTEGHSHIAPFLPLSPPGWRGIVVTVRAGGRAGGRLPDLRNPYLCNRLMDFLRSKFYGIV